MGDTILFLILAVMAIAAAAGMLLSRNAVHSALWLILNFGTIAVLYLILNAPFIAMVQITVYAGAIMVLFLFVIMLLGAERLGGVRFFGRQEILAAGLGITLLGVLVFVLLSGGGGGSGPMADNPGQLMDAGPTAVGLTLYESYVFPFEVTSILLLAAMIGVVALRTRRGNKDA
jgi:NADH-quinone oxidoreductase subunit J